jgi:DNA-directed RNA polymerase subunit H (RpoH/RPB5)
MATIKHDLVPKHTKLSEKEKEVLLKNYGIQVKDLPKIMKEDSAVASLNLKGGDVVKIERASRTSGHTVYYRGVWED